MSERSTRPRGAPSSARAPGTGPAFLLCNTYRFHGHHVGDVDRAYYRSEDEEVEWSGERDPLQILGEWLVAEGLADADALAQIETEIGDEVAAAAEHALAAPFPDPSEVDEHVHP